MPSTALKAQRSELGRRSEHAEALPFSRSLEPIYDLNRRVLALLAEHIDAGTQSDLLGTSIGYALRHIDPSIRDQIALCPFLLVDASFGDGSKWKTLEVVPEYAEAASLETDPVRRVLPLARATCGLSWCLVRTDPVAARLVLGVSIECAGVIARCGLTELHEVAARLVQFGGFKPRWHDRPEVWKRLIHLAQTKSRCPVAVHGLQLFLGDLLTED